MKKGYYIDKDENIVELFDENLYLHGMNLVELVLPENCIYCECYRNSLTKLILNYKCKELYCHTNKLTELILTENCTHCYCSYNKLTELVVPKNCELHCYNNNLNKMIEKLLMSQDSIKIQLANNLQK